MSNPPWTYSQLDTFESCAKKFYHTKVARDIVEPPTVHTIWGNKVHSAFEDFINDGTPLPDGMTQWQTLANKLAAMPGEKIAEQRYAIDKNFEPSPWKQSWTRGIADLVVKYGDKAVIMDYKTGKRKPTEQLDLYAAYIFHTHPEINTVATGFIWLKEKRIDWNVSKADRKPFRRDEIPVIWGNLLPRVHKLELAYDKDKWPAKPSGLCNGWCPVKHCEFYKEKR